MNKKATSFLIALVFLTCTSFLQAQNIFAIYLKDKNLNTYTTQKPEEFLSQKSIERRSAQNIAITEEDLPVSQAYINSIQMMGGKLRYSSKWLNVAVFDFADASIAYAQKNQPFVKEVYKIGSRNTGKSEKKASQNKPIFLKPTRIFENKKKINDDYLIQLQQIGIDKMHQENFTGKGILIAVFDAGFLASNTISAYNHIRSRNGFINTRDFVDGDTNVFDLGSHGTQVLSCIAGIEEGKTIGSAPDADFVLCRTEDGNSETLVEEYNWLAAAEFADSIGVDIINSSLGYTTFDADSQSHTYPSMDGKTAVVTRAAEIAASKGIIVINSAGNEGNKEWNYISCPADAQSVVTVGAMDENEYYVSFSGKGPTYDNRLKPNILARGKGTYIVNPDGSIGQSNGTSFSSPIIAGAFATLLQANQNKNSYSLLKQMVYQSASNYNAPNYEIGYGIPNFYAASNVILGLPNAHIQPIKITINPNPFVDILKLDIENFELPLDCYIGLFDELGRLVKKQKTVLNKGNNAIQFDNLSGLAKGAYTLFFETERQSYSFKVLKN